MNTEKGLRGYAAIGLVSPKNPINVAYVLRASGCYGASLVAASGIRYRHQFADTQRAYKHIPTVFVDDLKSIVPFDCVPVAIDLVDDAKSLVSFTHPERAFYVFGPEDGTLGKETLAWCKQRVMVPTEFCMNLAATVNVVLYDRLAKQLR
ncbi:MAG: RNA methyltransferase [Casimicrobium sp.]